MMNLENLPFHSNVKQVNINGKEALMLAPLDNEVIFKKAFTDKFVLESFVKDILGIEFHAGTIETEKQFSPQVGNIDFKYDIFAESEDHRIVVELQRVEYDYHFDRFLNYHYSAITELQRSHKEYKIEAEVYTIVLLTEAYTVKDKNTGMPVKDDVLVSLSDPMTLAGEVREVCGHKLVFLNASNPHSDTPERYRSWLTLINESINNRENPTIPVDNDAIRKVVDIIDYDDLPSSVITEMKIAEAKKAKEAHLKSIIAEQADVIMSKDNALAAKDNALAAKDNALAAKDNALALAVKALKAEGKSQTEIDRILGL